MKRRLMPRIAAALGLSAGPVGNASASNAMDRSWDPGFWDGSTRPDHGPGDLEAGRPSD